jgi:hybrid cluster-associated redox disulfide protein
VLFTSDTLIKDVIALHPEAAAVFERHGLGCAHCLAASMESVAEAASVHDLPCDVLLNDLNALEKTVPGGEF